MLVRPTFLLLVLPMLHILLCIAIQLHPGDGGWWWFPVFLVDLPISIGVMFIAYVLPPLAAFGIFGTLWWYYVGVMIRFLYRKFTVRQGSLI